MTAYSEWAAARTANGESPTDRGAFLLHLEALGLVRLPDLAPFGWGAPAQPGGNVLFFEAFNPPPVRVDVGPYLQKYAAQYAIPLSSLVGLIHAESGFNCQAERWCRHTAEAKAAIAANDRAALQAAIDACYADGERYDISFGLCQFIYTTAASEGIGNGQASIDNLLAVRAALFDPETGVRMAAKHYAERCYSRARAAGYAGDEAILRGYFVYNTGGLEPPGGRFSGNVATYENALALAKQVLAGKGFE